MSVDSTRISLRGQALLGALIVGSIAFAFNFRDGVPEALVAGGITAVVVGGAYYLGLRVSSIWKS